MELRGASALVTGGASGLGRAVVQMLLKAGASVVVVDLPDRSEGDRVRANSLAELGEAARFIPGDVRDEDLVARAVNAAAGLGELRVAVNCAGVATPGKLVGKDGPLGYERFMEVLSINAGGTLNVMAHAAAAMRGNAESAGERGVIINTASVAAFEGQIGQMAYAASKGAVASMTLPAARELAREAVRVVTVAPGLFETPMMAGLPESAKESLRSKTMHPPRLGKPEDFAQLVEQIMANPMLNGETIRLDGAVRLEPR